VQLLASETSAFHTMDDGVVLYGFGKTPLVMYICPTFRLLPVATAFVTLAVLFGAVCRMFQNLEES